MPRRSVRSATGVLACALALPIALLASACEPAPPRPANDDFGAAVALASTASGTVSGTTTGAVLQPGEDPSYGTHSVWYRWRAPSTGVVTLSSGGGLLGAGAEAFTGSTYRTLRPVSQFGAFTDETFDVTAGTTYTFRVVSPAGGSFALRWKTFTAPDNDNRQRAAALTGATGSLTVDTTAATRQPSDPAIDGVKLAAPVWYRWTAPATGWYAFDAAGSRGDAGIAAYTDDGSLTLLDSSLGGCDTGISYYSGSSTSAATIGFAAQSGRTYLLQLGSTPFSFDSVGGDDVPFQLPSFGDRMQLNWRSVAQAPVASGNDAFAAATRLTGTSGTVRGTTVGATAEAGEPAHDKSPARSSVWFRFTPTVTADYLLQASPADSDSCYSRLAVYTGSAVNRLTAVPASSKPAPLEQLFPLQSPALAGEPAIPVDLNIPKALVGSRVHLIAGRTYSVAVDRESTAAAFSLHWDIPQAVPVVRSVTVGNGSIGVIWTPPPATAGSRRSAYLVTAVPVKPNDDTQYSEDVPVPVTSSFTTLKGLTNGVAYRVVVAAVNDAGPGDLYVSAPVVPRR